MRKTLRADPVRSRNENVRGTSTGKSNGSSGVGVAHPLVRVGTSQGDECRANGHDREVWTGTPKGRTLGGNCHATPVCSCVLEFQICVMFICRPYNNLVM
jgi:hypothetical protein